MTWTVSNLIIQIIAGVLGAHGAAAGLKEHNFGALGHTLAGAVGGTLSGVFLQTVVRSVTVTGIPIEPTLLERVIIQGIVGAAAGAATMMVIGFISNPQ
jgi:uncharacterized membrane protein YtjA (UPF0391 family)